jgi:hypothetical protein
MPRRRFSKSQIGPDIDLDKDEVHLADGTRLTEAAAQRLAEEMLARRRGRPSVSGSSVRTPSLTVRVPAELRSALESIAETRGERLADVSRAALEEYVERHAS